VLGSGRAEHGIEGAGGKRFSPHDRDLVSILEDQQRQIQDLATTVLEQQKEVWPGCVLETTTVVMSARL